jgi:hypothetical protein
MAHLVAVVTFNVVLVTLLLAICSKGLIWAILLALLDDSVVVLVGYESNDLVGCDGIVGAVSCNVDSTNGGLVGKGEGA